MQRYVAFLGGINVGGHRVNGPQLARAFEELGLRDVATFLASGNVVFSADEDAGADLTARIEEHLERTLGYAVPTFLRDAEGVRHIAGHRPFAEGLVEASHGKLQVVLLRAAPDDVAVTTVDELSSEQDRLVVDGTELYWLPSGGIGGSALDLRVVAAAVGPSTTRTANTVRRIAAKFLDG